VFRRPPASSEQVLHPEKYLAGEPPREVNIDAVALGKREVEGVGGDASGRGRRARAVAGGRGGSRGAQGRGRVGRDRAAVFAGEGERQLFVWQTVWDGREDAREFFRAYNSLLRRGRGAEVIEGAEAYGGEESALWREGNLRTLVRLEGDAVVVLRGAAADVESAARIVK
jgi:hypothetical protein